MMKKLLAYLSNQAAIRWLKENKSLVLTVNFLAILADIFFIKESSDLRLFGLLGIYLVCVWFYRLRSRLTFLIALGLLGVMFVLFLLTGTSQPTEKAAVWLFFILGTGIIQQLKE